MKTLFGTDGIRAVAGEYPLDPSSIVRLGRGLAALLEEEGLPAAVLVGRDTRESGGWIERSFASGFREAGGEASSAGVLPTSAVSFLTKTRDFSAGIVISASHNPYRDNGIKIFSSQGYKIPDVWEERLEAGIIAQAGPGAAPEVDVEPDPAFLREYEAFLRGRFGGGRAARPLKVVLDCANGASSTAAPDVLRALGFEVVPLACSPDGHNINLGCGSLHPEALARAVQDRRADLGIAYDGDADRALWVDEKGRVLNGDHTLYVLSRAMVRDGRLKGGAVVATTMSNMGLEKAVAGQGLRFERTKVGDKYVLERMIEIGANLGGERSGHTILLDDCPTGDGLLTSLKMLGVMDRERAFLSDLVSGYKEFPQVLRNVRVSSKPDLASLPEVAAAIAEVEAAIVGRGRLDVRYSGTEPLARVMVEGEDKAQVEAWAARIAIEVEKRLGCGV